MNWAFVSDDTLRQLFHGDRLTYSQIAEKFPGATRNKVAGRCTRMGLFREKIAKPAPPPVISVKEQAERELDQRDIDILCDLHEGHNQSECAKHYGVSKSHVQKLAAARSAA